MQGQSLAKYSRQHLAGRNQPAVVPQGNKGNAQPDLAAEFFCGEVYRRCLTNRLTGQVSCPAMDRPRQRSSRVNASGDRSRAPTLMTPSSSKPAATTSPWRLL